MVGFCDADHHYGIRKAAFLAGLLIGNVRNDSMFHLTFCSSHKTTIPLKSIGSGQFFGADESMNAETLIVNIYVTLLSFDPDLIIIVDTKKPFTALNNQRLSTD